MRKTRKSKIRIIKKMKPKPRKNDMKELIENLLKLENHQCRYIIENRYCCEPTTDGKSYCPEHMTKVYNKCSNNSKREPETQIQAQTELTQPVG